jgi:two-component system cell cycle response regulator CtrA
MRLLLVENSVSITTLQICDDRSVVERAETADDVMSVLRREVYDIVVLSMASMLHDGFDLIRRIRGAKNRTPLLALTGSAVADRVRALDLGADDAIAEPVDPAELRARLMSVVRRSRGFSQSLLRVGDLSLCLTTREVKVGAIPIQLTDKEYAMLELMVMRKGSILTKETFLNHLYGGLDEPEAQIIDLFICRLRKKLSRAGADPLIGTVWGRGYMIRDDPNERSRRVSGLIAKAGPHELVH